MHGVAFVFRKRSSNRRNGGSLSFFAYLRPGNEKRNNMMILVFIYGIIRNASSINLYLLGEPLVDRRRRSVSRCGDRLSRCRLSRSSLFLPSLLSLPESRAVCFFSRSLSRSERSKSRLSESFLPKSHSRTGLSTAGG